MTIVAEAFVRIRPDDKDFPGEVEKTARKAAEKGGDAARKTLRERFHAAGKESHSTFLSAFDHFGEEFRHRFLQGIQFGIGAFTGIRAFQGLESVFAEGFQSEKLFQTSTAQLNQVLKTTHGVAGESADSVDKLSEKIAGYSGETVNALRNSQVMLLGFTNIRDIAGKNNDIFARASIAAEDLSKRYGLDVASSARTLGRALNDPARGLLLLRRAGIQLTAQQADQAKKLAEHGKVLEAQKVILKAVEQRVGGAANAYGKTLPGQVARAREQLNEFSRVAVEALLPSITRAGTGLLNFAKTHAAEAQRAFQTLGDWIGRVVTVLGAVATFIGQHAGLFKALAVGALATATAIKGIAIAQALWNAVSNANPILLIIKAVVGLAGALIYAWRTSSTFRDGVKTAFSDIEHAVGVAVSFIIKAFKWWVDAQLAVFSVIVNGAARALGWIPGLGGALKSAASAFNSFRTSVDSTLTGLANDAYNLGTSAGKNWLDGWTHGAAAQPKARVVNGKLTYPVGFIGPIPKGAQIGPIAPNPGTPGVHDIPAAPPKVKIPTTSFATSPDFTAPGAAKAAGSAVKQVVARAVPLNLTAAEVVKAFAAAVAKGRPGVLAEITKLSSQIRTALNQPAAHAQRDSLIEFLDRRRKSLGDLADRYVTITKKIDAATQQLTDAQQAQADFFTSLRDTFTSAAQLSNVLSGLSDQINPGGEAVGGFLQHQVNSLNSFLDNLDRLKAEGLSGDLIKQLAQAGPDSGGRIAAGLAGATQAQIARINALEAQLQSRATQGAQQLTNDFYQAGIDQLKSELATDRKELGKISAAINNLERHIGDDVGKGVAAGLNAVAAAANARSRARTRQSAAGNKAR